MTVASMISAGQLERVARDAAGADAALGEAKRHVESARAISAGDPNGAYQLAYDAARKAVAAHMRREGLRVRRGEGAHALTAQYARYAIDEGLGHRLDTMRRRRNRSEYGSAFFVAADVTDAVGTAEQLIGLVDR